MRIRTEQPKDFDLIYNFVKEAFFTAKVSDGTEQDFVNQLRGSDGYIPELALLVEEGGELIGHIMLTRRKIKTEQGEVPVLLLAPVAVRLDKRGQGIGSILMEEALGRARRLGHQAVFLVGEPKYYSRFGFKQADIYGVSCTRPIPSEFVQALELVSGGLSGASGTINLE